MARVFRVRELLERLNQTHLGYIRNSLPERYREPPVTVTQRYPAALLGVLPKGTNYLLLGVIAESVLRLSSDAITLDSLIAAVKVNCALDAVAESKVRKSKTTQQFIDCLVTTRRKMEEVLLPGAIEFEPRVASGRIEGHPDMKNATQIFEVKLTGLLDKNWAAFLAQVFAYGALCPEVTELYLVLPLQQRVVGFGIAAWTGRLGYLKALEGLCCSCGESREVTLEPGRRLCAEYNIGQHAAKYPRILDSLRPFTPRTPYQIFLGGPKNSHVAVRDDDIAASAADIAARELVLFVHSQYIINLCTKSDDDWNVKLLIKNLDVTRALGGRGVVVHVGKAVGKGVKEALENMRDALTRAIEHASPDCFILLETPAGQGTETLTGRTEFLDFVESFKDPRLRVCVDTCHVFACGHDPVEYIADATRRGLLKLVHFNDSLGDCGSCVDRHSFAGTGKIGIKVMTEVAKFCSEASVPMLFEVPV